MQQLYLCSVFQVHTDSRIVLSARPDICRAVFTFIEFYGTCTDIYRRFKVCTTTLFMFSVSGSHSYWLTPTIIYSRIVLSARPDVCRAVFTFIEFYGTCTDIYGVISHVVVVANGGSELKVDGDGVVFRSHQLLAGWFPQITCRRLKVCTTTLLAGWFPQITCRRLKVCATTLFMFSVSGSHRQQNSFVRAPRYLPRGIYIHRVLRNMHRYL